ncbi:MAG: hypothetical protein KJO61_04890, partial [Deltaproteobacteria bacterium]|nr:hypothetical protein [Deltaproteobacteria bacterium]
MYGKSFKKICIVFFVWVFICLGLFQPIDINPYKESKKLLYKCLKLFSNTANAASEQVEKIPLWPHDKSDLHPDPAIVYGKLPNGFRYVLMENHEPKKRVSMHL